MKTKNRKTITLLTAFLLLLPLAAACDREEGPAEELGESIDDFVDETQDQGEDLGEKLEDTKEELQEGAEEVKEELEDDNG